MTTHEAQRKATRALALYEEALNEALEVMRDRYPTEARDRDEWSISGAIYRGHHGFRLLRLRIENETEATA